MLRSGTPSAAATVLRLVGVAGDQRAQARDLRRPQRGDQLHLRQLADADQREPDPARGRRGGPKPAGQGERAAARGGQGEQRAAGGARSSAHHGGELITRSIGSGGLTIASGSSDTAIALATAAAIANHATLSAESWRKSMKGVPIVAITT